MKIEMGESLIYSWLRHEKLCQLVQTNWKVSPFWEGRLSSEVQQFMRKDFKWGFPGQAFAWPTIELISKLCQ